MLAPASLPVKFSMWNRSEGAPGGYERPRRALFRFLYSDEAWLRLRGPFAVQPGNNASRRYEYPWAYHAIQLSRRSNVVELGGSLSGFQFVLSREGHRVTNIDPGLDADGMGWPVDTAQIARMNSLFGTKVDLIQTTLDKADLKICSADAVFAISVLEHLTQAELDEVIRHVQLCLRPGGHFVVTLDLFLNIAPFTSVLNNRYGCNKDVFRLVSQSNMCLLKGVENELFGFPSFHAESVLSNLADYMIGSYPTLTQCFVLQKPY